MRKEINIKFLIGVIKDLESGLDFGDVEYDRAASSILFDLLDFLEDYRSSSLYEK